MADGVQIEGMVFEAATAMQGGASPSASDRAVAPNLQEDDLALDRSLRPKKLCDYLGQTKVKESLAILIEAAQQRKEGKGAVVGCAGCYPTATTLAAAPAVRLGLVDDKAPIVVDAISGVTGAGKKATARTHFCFANENLEAYGVATHRHTPEIEQILGVSGRLVFTPHLAPLNRGLLSTVNLPLATGATRDVAKIIESYKEFYQNSAFVTVLDQGVMPKTSSVVGTNCAHIGLAVNERVGMLIAVGAIDNLCKGAANQAVQCANIVFGMPEDLGLDKVAVPV